MKRVEIAATLMNDRIGFIDSADACYRSKSTKSRVRVTPGDSSGGYGKYGGPILVKLPLECRNLVRHNYIGRHAVPQRCHSSVEAVLTALVRDSWEGEFNLDACPIQIQRVASRNQSIGKMVCNMLFVNSSFIHRNHGMSSNRKKLSCHLSIPKFIRFRLPSSMSRRFINQSLPRSHKCGLGMSFGDSMECCIPHSHNVPVE